MKPIAVITLRSTSLRAIAYDGERALLEVYFHDASLYRYFGVPVQTYTDLLQADSQGSFFNARIRNQFPYVRV